MSFGKGSPCLLCSRVVEPDNCENKNCRPWREWYLQRWEDTRRLLCYGAVSPAEDPCNRCVCPRQMCMLPCQAKLDWERQVQS